MKKLIDILLCILLIITLVFVLAMIVPRPAHSSPGQINATVCALIDVGNGFRCMDCGNGCIISVDQNMDRVPVQTFTVYDIGQ
jgi:hypothetical protein